MRALTTSLLFGLSLLGSVGMQPSAYADSCTSDVRVGSQTITVEVACAPTQATPAARTGSRVCEYGGKAIPCSTAAGVWHSTRLCYVKRLEPQPPKSAAVWAGRSDGAVYSCSVLGESAVASAFWAPSVGVAVPPDPQMLAERAAASMQLRPVTIGIVPEDKPDSVGIIGLPVWLWVADRGPQVTGPITRSASLDGYSVTATAVLNEVVWDLGDGTTVRCGLGTPYADVYGKRPSPTCGHVYQKQGEYTVQATSVWVVSWSGIGDSDSFVMRMSSSTRIVEAELQVVRTR